MTPTPAEQSHETPADMLARSAFGFALFALIPTAIAWLFFLFAPPSPFQIYRLIRLGIIMGFGGLVLVLGWLMMLAFRTKPERLLPFADRFVRFFQAPLVSASIVMIIIEVNVFAFLILRGVAPSITNPAKGLMVAWSLLFIGMIAIVHLPTLAEWWQRSLATWAGIGFFIVAGGCVILLVSANNWLITLSGVNDVLRGSLDYRQLDFYDDGKPAPSLNAFWAEQAQTSVRWSPYTYWVMGAYNGDYITVRPDGLRETPHFGDGTHDIYMFGGSTMWGEGARDAYTIPGHVARLLDEHDTPQNVVNYGQSGYVSMQDIIWFQLQLQQGNVPDIAVVYQGFNDILSAYGSGYVGVTLQERMRLNDSEAGRRLRAGQPVFRLPTLTLDSLDLSSAGIEPISAQAIVDNWFANVEMTQTLADAYGVEVIFVWQPALIFKETLTDMEQAMLEQTEVNRPGLFTLYAEADTLMRNNIANTDATILVLSDLFADTDMAIFHDLVHINEIGNLEVAEAILPAVQALLDSE